MSEVARCVGASWRCGGHRHGPHNLPQEEDPNPSHSLSLGMLVGCPHPRRSTSVRVTGKYLDAGKGDNVK